MARATTTIAFLFLFATFVFSQKSTATAPYLFSSFFADKNLSSLNITCFFQDSKGYMWIGTEDGVNYFNGKTIKVFKHDRTYKNSLPDNQVVSICEDKNGFIWIGTGRGVSKLNPDLLRFENFYNDAEGHGLGYKVSAYVDKENNVWALSGGELYAFNAQNNSFGKRKFKVATAFKNTPAPYLYNGIFQDSKKRYWVSCSDHLYRYFPGTGLFEPFPTPKPNLFFFGVSEDAKGNLFCGTWDSGLYHINTASNRLDVIDSSGLHGCYVMQQLNGQPLLWYGSLQLKTYNMATKTISYQVHDVTNPYSCRNSDVSALYVDAQNQLWIGYVNNGIQILSPSNQNFKSYSISENKNEFPVVSCFIKTNTYDYVGGWYNYSLARLDKNHQLVKKWKTVLPGTFDHENNISDAWEDKQGNLWFAASPGLIKFNPLTEKAELFKMDSAMSRKSHFLDMEPEGDSVLWLAGYFCGLSRFSLRTKTFQNWGAKAHSLFWSLTKDNSGMLWLADNAGLLVGFDRKTKTLIPKRYDALTEGAIYHHILFDSLNNALWIATTNGLLRVDRKTFTARLFTEKDNLPTSQVNTIQLDSKHRLWIATNKGLSFYEPAQNLFKTLLSTNGLPDNALTQLFSIQPDDELFIGSRDGFSVLETNAVFSGSSPQAVSINKVYESGLLEPITVIEDRKTIALNYDRNNLQIEFSSNDLINSEDNQLQFRLEGFDSEWNTAQNGIVNYNKLAPGTYLFHVTGVNHAGLKSKQDDFLWIVISPPFWKTAWFIALIALVLLALTLFIARYIFTRNLREKILILEKEQAIEKERSRISQDMHDELGSGLTKISIMSEVAKMQLTDPAKAKHQLENISSSSRVLVDNLQDIIWILNSRNDSLENLCAYIQEYALKYFEPSEIRVQAEFPEKIPVLKLPEDQRRNILLVFKETFNNISKHSGGNLVTIHMKEEGPNIVFTVTDNGKGFDKSSIRPFANGLQNMKKRMADINGSFEISSTLQQGTVSLFMFKA